MTKAPAIRKHLNVHHWDEQGQCWVRYLLALQGSDKICMGSDYPFPLGDLELGAYMLDMGLEDTELENLFCNAAMQWLDLDRASFE